MRFVILIQTFLLLLNTHTLQERDAQASFFCLGSALAVDLPSDSEVNQQTTGYAGVISIALASRKIPPMLS